MPKVVEQGLKKLALHFYIAYIYAIIYYVIAQIISAGFYIREF